jgi:cephalosporin hydroxylase
MNALYAFSLADQHIRARVKMKLILDCDNQTLRIEQRGEVTEHPLYTKEAFELLSREWVRIGWSLEYYHTFTWLGLPILQLPEDLVRLQEVIHTLRPDVIVETGVCLGGSLLFHSSLLSLLGHGRVIGVERILAPETRERLIKHPLAQHIKLVEGDSTSAETLQKVRSHIAPSDKVMVILDSDHSADHVGKELKSYAPLVTPGSCILVEDAIMSDLRDVPGGHADWNWNHPGAAVRQFLAETSEFQLKTPPWLFNKSGLRSNITYWPDGWLWRTA